MTTQTNGGSLAPSTLLVTWALVFLGLWATGEEEAPWEKMGSTEGGVCGGRGLSLSYLVSLGHNLH